MRREYVLTSDQLMKLIEASRPTPVMFLSGGVPIFDSPQENANRAWRALGEEMGFQYLTARPIPGKSAHFFTAESV